MNAPEKISIAMATYNGERFIGEQLASLAAQTLPPCELVIGDDGSSDRTLEIVDRFAAAAPFPVRVQRNQPRLGSGTNFLETARRCNGAWIAYCDQDDIWLPNKLERLMAVACTDPAVVFLAHRGTIIDADGKPQGEFNEPAIEHLSIVAPLGRHLWRAPYGFTQVFHRSLVQEFPFETRPVSVHDVWIFWVANVVGRTAFVPDRLALYRRHQSNATQFYRNPELGTQLAGSAQQSEYAGASEKVAKFVTYLREREDAVPGPLRNRVSAGAEFYERLAGHLHWRAQLWDRRRPMSTRFTAMVRVAAAGGYRAVEVGGVGWRAAGKDIARLFWLKPEAINRSEQRS